MTIDATPDASRDDAGSTLLEMLVVVALLALATGIVFADMRRPFDRLAAETARDAAVADLRAARADAVRGERRVRFDVAPDGRSYGWEGARRALTAGVTLRGPEAPLVFAADGAVSGGRLVVVSVDGGRVPIDLDPASGLVLVDRRLRVAP